MINTAAMKTEIAASEITFKKQFNGYDKDEVDRYINNLAQAYQTAYEEYAAVCAKYNELLEAHARLGEQQEQNKSGAAVIARTLVDAETLAQKIIADAYAEADKIKAETHAEAQKLKEDAYIEKAAARIEAQKLIDDANAETSGAKGRADKVIADAQDEAAQISFRARSNLEQADASVRQIINKLQGLLSPTV
jgi:DivIVA domain-containing protein